MRARRVRERGKRGRMTEKRGGVKGRCDCGVKGKGEGFRGRE